MANSNPNTTGLIPLNKRTEEDRRKIQDEGRKKAHENRKKKKILSEYMEAALNTPIRNKKMLDIVVNNFDFENEDLTYNAGVVAGIIDAAARGNTEAVKLIREMVNDRPVTDTTEKQIVKIPAELIGKAFTELNHYVSIRKFLEYWLEGGRNSLKSSYVGLKVIEEIENNPTWCCACFRKVQNKLKKSIYQQIIWAIEEMNKYYPGLKDDYKIKKSPLEIEKMSTGQIISFDGLDDPGKLKSTKPPPGKYFAIQVWEEFDQFAGTEEVRMIDQTFLRGGETFVKFYMYNTPKSAQHWVNVEKIVPKEKRYIHKSNMYQAKYTGWVSKVLYDEAEHLRKVNNNVWKNEFLGEITGTGGQVFENLEIREITDTEIETFGLCFQGLDWGWFPDPTSWGRMHYNPATQILYIFDEIYGCKVKNTVLAKEIINKKVNAEECLCDSAQPKDIQDIKTEGVNARPTHKFQGSIEYGMKWLQTRVKIVIDPIRCPNHAKEFGTYELEKDKNDNFITSYPDKNNHTIDEVRYACLRYILSSISRA